MTDGTGTALAFIYDRQRPTDTTPETMHARLDACRVLATTEGWEIAHWAADQHDQAASDHDRPALDIALQMMMRVPDDRLRYLVTYDLTALSDDKDVREVHVQRVRRHGGAIRAVLAQPTVCAVTATLTLDQLALATRYDLEQSASVADAIAAPRCDLEAGHDGPHHGVVLSLPGSVSGAVWALWDETGQQPLLAVFQDCPARTRNGMDACATYANHPGRHAYELYDEELARATAVAAAAPFAFNSGPSNP